MADSSHFRTAPCVDMRFSRAGRIRGNLPKKNGKFFDFFWTFGSTSTETDRANVRHKRPPFSTKLFTRVIKLDPGALMGPKGKRNRQGALPVLLHGPRRTPGTPGYPL